MCRFLSVKSKEKFLIQRLAVPFSQKCKQSKEWQGDGWGACWLDQNNNWQIFRSLLPIWKDKAGLNKIPASKIFLIHARSSSFEKDKNQIKYNQPFIDKNIAFVFNGIIIGVKNSIKIPGEIGSQKIFNLTKSFISNHGGIEAGIEKTKKIIESNSKKIKGMNISVCDKEKFYNLCRYGSDAEYYQIRYFKDKNKVIICSEDISGFKFKKMKNGQILTI